LISQSRGLGDVYKRQKEKRGMLTPISPQVSMLIHFLLEPMYATRLKLETDLTLRFF
jgi:hypothetical protein